MSVVVVAEVAYFATEVYIICHKEHPDAEVGKGLCMANPHKLRTQSKTIPLHDFDGINLHAPRMTNSTAMHFHSPNMRSHLSKSILTRAVIYFKEAAPVSLSQKPSNESFSLKGINIISNGEHRKKTTV
jgi:hypothetical protein